MKITEKKLIRILKHLPEYIQKSDAKIIAEKIIAMNDDPTLIKKKKRYKPIEATDLQARRLGKYVNAHRIKAKHKGVRPYREKTKDWNKLKELTSMVVQFINEFELDPTEGMNDYIRISLRVMNTKSKASIINKMVLVYDAVISEYEDRLEMKDDPTPDLTERIFDRYKAMIIKSTGIRSTNPIDKSETLIYFYRMKKLAEESKVSPFTFMEAQFEELEWTGNYPSPSQLIGQRAVERLFKNRYESNSTDSKIRKPDGDIVKRLTALKRK